MWFMSALNYVSALRCVNRCALNDGRVVRYILAKVYVIYIHIFEVTCICTKHHPSVASWVCAPKIHIKVVTLFSAVIKTTCVIRYQTKWPFNLKRNDTTMIQYDKRLLLQVSFEWNLLQCCCDNDVSCSKILSQSTVIGAKIWRVLQTFLRHIH